ncbi:hypothetical protein ACN42_g2920 [Penicillium freii]|uniref:Uncharacterized protein n=1 Tax=Penicillium freii TaxID=48697 RepID=A0A124GSE5_PENFR|nr:hypothetical protein ACN42_g2920 [Penicillium freii]
MGPKDLFILHAVNNIVKAAKTNMKPLIASICLFQQIHRDDWSSFPMSRNGHGRRLLRELLSPGDTSIAVSMR